MNCDSELWNNDLAKDIHDTLKLKENSVCRIQGNSPLLYWRRYLVDWLALTCQKFRLNSNAQHLAVALYDRFTDSYTIPIDDLKMLVVCCLLVASKYEEREEKIPKFKILMEYLQWQLKASDYLVMELKLLSAFSWNIGFSTASHFKEYYMQLLKLVMTMVRLCSSGVLMTIRFYNPKAQLSLAAVIFLMAHSAGCLMIIVIFRPSAKVAITTNDLHVGRQLTNPSEAYVYMEKNVNYFLEVSLQDPAFLAFKPSLITAACIASARICLHITPTWTNEMRKKSLFSWSHLVPCIEILLRLHDEDCKATKENIKGNTNPQQSSLNSTGNTPITSPVPTASDDLGSSTQHISQYSCIGRPVATVQPLSATALAPAYRYSKGYSGKRL